MNVINFPSHNKPINANTGELQEDYFNFLSMNNQESQLFFSQDGHLVPTRKNSELVGNGTSTHGLSTKQYTARFAYNGDTDNHMANVAGQYKNITVNQLSTRAAIVSSTPMPNRIEQYGDENKNLYTNVNGTTFQNLTVPLTFPISFTSDGTNLLVNINGVSSDVVLSDPAIPMRFLSFDGTNLVVSINGVSRTITTT
jgi:hypothetical protein